jgi:serine/threonine-protein kinase HipA
MKRCPITYKPIRENQRYSISGLKLLSPYLNDLKDLPYSAEEQRQEALAKASKISIQGVQPKLSVRLSLKESSFILVDQKGTFILKPQNHLYQSLPENEDLTMKLAKGVGIEVPIHGLCYAKDGSLTYFIRRFDRYDRDKKRMQEDFAQLSGHNRDTKYNSSIEKLITIVDEFCTFPTIEKLKIFRRLVFCFLTGNEDMHLKNYSILIKDNIIGLSPAYDLLNSTIALKGATEESALPLKGKKSKLTKDDFFSYLAVERLGLNQQTIQSEINNFKTQIKIWPKIINSSFLTQPFQADYLKIVEERSKRLELA